MKCPNCGAEILSGNVCNFCGSKVADQDDSININLNFWASSGEPFDVDELIYKQSLIDQIKVFVESTISVVKNGRSNHIITPRYDPEEQTRKDVYCYFLYIFMNGGSVDDEELEAIEASTKYRIDSKNWQRFIRKERVDSEARYLSKPPETIRYLVRLDNTLYYRGFNCESAGMIKDMYRILGKLAVDIYRNSDEKIQDRVDKYINMLERYLRKNVKNPRYEIASTEIKDRPMCEPF